MTWIALLSLATPSPPAAPHDRDIRIDGVHLGEQDPRGESNFRTP